VKASLVLGAGRGPRLEILERIKRSGVGRSVKELSTELGMSYMGVKAHCMALAKEGYLAPFRKPSSTSTGACRGRPTMIYRIAPAGEQLFSGIETDFPSLLLQQANSLYGPTAAQKILVMTFRDMASRYSGMVGTGSIEEKASLFAKARDREGRMSEFIAGNPWVIKECSQDNGRLSKDFPAIFGLEEHLVAEVLGVPIQREERGGVVIFRPC
jgi:hypothetical protein